MPSNLSNDDLFIIGRHLDAAKQTYKTPYTEIQKKIQDDTGAIVIVSDDAPTTLENGEPLLDGTLWYTPKDGGSLEIYDKDNGQWIPITGAGTRGVEKIIAGDNITIDPDAGVGVVTVHGVVKTKPEYDEVTDGDLWVDVDQCPPKLNIWTDCDDPNGEWIPIGPPDKQYLMQDRAGNVFVRGNVFIKNELNDNEQILNFSPKGMVEINQYGDIYIENNLFVGVETDSSALEPVIPYEPVYYDDDFNVQIEGKLIILGSLYTLVGDANP